MPIVSFIPERYAQGFNKIATLEDAKFELIKEALAYTPLVSSILVLSNNLANETKIDEDDLQEMILSISSLITFLDSEDKIDELAEDISVILFNEIEADEELPNEPISDITEKSIRERILFLLENKQIYYASKASELSSESGNVYLRSKILSEIRPVFDINVSNPVKAGMILHNLHIHYKAREEGPHEDIFLTLDSKDLIELKEAISRAENKEISLKAIFKKAEIETLE
ncbi:hypothetical protein ACFOW1_05065 [Parasediminibacterium paludis]|uniref:Uncharacterized protein n=1 Tax=Parasediminibacterium paludis TaxID=908966 RepID=A0ABV8PSZ7_9BACT